MATPGRDAFSRPALSHPPMRRSRSDPDAFTMPFGEHLEELRKRLLLALAAPIPLMVLFFAISRPMIDVLRGPIDAAMRANGLSPQLQVISPPEFLLTQLKLSFVAAMIVSAPWVIWQLWLFVRPGLYPHEQRFVYVLLPFSALLTAAAVALTYWVMLPLMLTVLIGLGTDSPSVPDENAPNQAVRQVMEANPQPPVRLAAPTDPPPGSAWLLWPGMELSVTTAGADGGVIVHHVPRPSPSVAQVFRLGSYVNFALFTLLATAIAFQLPLVVMLLGWVGLIDTTTLRSKRKYALLILAIVAAVVTPSPDPLSMIAMLLPLYGLYELGILLLRFVPARAVASGAIIELRRSEKSMARTDQPAQAARAESPESPQDDRPASAGQSRGRPADDPEAEP
jgi:sec-independent protein translocase protein TatC